MVDIKLGVFEMVEQARAEIEEVDTVDAIEQAQDPDCLVIDIRDVRERKRNGYIPGSFHCPRGMIEFWVDPESPYFQGCFQRKETISIPLCRGLAVRSNRFKLSLKWDLENAAHIKGGLNAWCEAGGPFTKDEG
jgi:rhodanese-related sulfurtransferase